MAVSATASAPSAATTPVPGSGSRWLVAPLAIFLATRAALAILSYAGLILVPTNPVYAAKAALAGHSLLDGWLRWEAIDWLALAQWGCWFDAQTGEASAHLLPLYPALVALVNWPTAQVGVAALLVSNCSLALALVLLYRWLFPRWGHGPAALATTLLCVLPYSFLFASAYPYSLALLFLVLTFWCSERAQPWRASLCGACAALAAPVGPAIWPTLVVAHLHPHASGGRRGKALLSTLLVPVGLVGAGYYLAAVGGLPWQLVVTTLAGLDSTSPLASGLPWPGEAGIELDAATLVLGGTFGAALGGLALTPLVQRELGLTYAAFHVTLILVAALSDPAHLGALLLLDLPFVLLVVRLLQGELAQTLALAASAMVLALLTACFVSWHVVGGVERSPLENGDPTRLLARQRALGAMPAVETALTVGDDFLLLGHSRLGKRYQPGESIRLAVDLQRIRASERHYLLALHLADLAGVRWGSSEVSLPALKQPLPLTGEGAFRLWLDLPIAAQTPAGVYRLELSPLVVPPYSAAYEKPPLAGPGGERLDVVSLGTLVIGGPDAVIDEARSPTRPQPPALLGEEMQLLDYELSALAVGGQESATVTLYWGAASRPGYDYTVFVQVLDAAGRLVAQSDGYPLAGRYPTSYLEPGVVLRDTHRLALPAGEKRGPLRVIAGVYRLDTMRRLPVRCDECPAGRDYVDLGTLALP